MFRLLFGPLKCHILNCGPLFFLINSKNDNIKLKKKLDVKCRIDDVKS